MKVIHFACALAVLLVSGALIGAGTEAPDDLDVTKSPALLLSPAVKASDLEVYGVKLGDAVTRIPARAGVNRRPGDRPQDAIYVGPNVTYFAFQDTVYQIRVYGDITNAMPPYTVTRLQMKLGKADDVREPEVGTTCLTYFAPRLQFTFVGNKNVGAIDLYAP